MTLPSFEVARFLFPIISLTHSLLVPSMACHLQPTKLIHCQHLPTTIFSIFFGQIPTNGILMGIGPVEIITK